MSGRDHAWRLGAADALVAGAPTLVRTARRLPVDVTDPGSMAAGVAWWQALTAAGGEGMVVEPSRPERVGRGVQHRVAVRGREHLRLVHGPQCTEPGTWSGCAAAAWV